MSHKPKYDNNYLTAQNGCTIIEQSSQRQRGPASSILSSDPKSVWVTGEKLPQQCVISLKRIIKKPAFYNMVGIYCWHQYDSNPALIEILGKSVPQLDKWHLITKIRLNLIDSWQYFKIEDLNADKIKQIKIRILENFGDTKTYINKVSLHYANPILSKQNAYATNTNISSNMKVNYSQHEQQMPERPPTLNSNSSPNANANTNTNTNKSPFSKDQRREKIHSQYYKPDAQNYNSNYTSINSNISTQMQNQLKKANQNIHRLNIQQEQMKKIIQKQQKVIIQMQEAMKIVILSMQKLQKMQQIQKKTHNSYKSSQNFKKIRNQQQFQNNNPYSHIPKHPPKQKVLQKYKISREVPLSSDQQQQNIYKQKIKQKDRIIRSKQKQKFVKKSHQANKYNEQIQQLSNMLNQYQTKSHVIVNSKQKYQASSSKQRDMQKQRQRLRIRQKQKQKQKQKKLLKIAQLQRKKQSQFRQNSQSYKHQTDIIRTNSQDDLSQYDEYHYKTSQATQNQDLLHPGTKSQKTKQKGQKAKMLQRLVKLIQLKKKKLQLKRSGAKSRQRQSVYQYQQQDDQNQDQNQDEQN